jgi:hypothetical protein
MLSAGAKEIVDIPDKECIQNNLQKRKRFGGEDSGKENEDEDILDVENEAGGDVPVEDNMSVEINQPPKNNVLILAASRDFVYELLDEDVVAQIERHLGQEVTNKQKQKKKKKNWHVIHSFQT